MIHIWSTRQTTKILAPFCMLKYKGSLPISSEREGVLITCVLSSSAILKYSISAQFWELFRIYFFLTSQMHWSLRGAACLRRTEDSSTYEWCKFKENVHFRVTALTVWISLDGSEETQKQSRMFLWCFWNKEITLFLSNKSDGKKQRELKWKYCSVTEAICWRLHLPSCWFHWVWTVQGYCQ